MISNTHDGLKENRNNVYMLNKENFKKFGDNIDKVKEQSRSVVAFIWKKHLKKDENSSIYTFVDNISTLKTDIQDIYHRPLGENEPFADEITPARGSGCYVPGYILTAAHIVCKENSNQLDMATINDLYVVFDFVKETENGWRTTFDDSQVFEIKKVKAHCYFRGDNRKDYALLKLNKKVEGRTPMVISSTPIKKDEEVYLWGFPGGTPLKFTDGGVVMKTNQPNYVECKITALEGNSGGPICRVNSLEVVAILCAGNRDYKIDEKTNTCISYKILKKKIKIFEICQRISVLCYVKDCIELTKSGFKLKTDSVPQDVKSPGLYLWGRCKKCSDSKRPVWSFRHKQGTFHLEELLYKSTCRSCPKENLTVEDIGLHNCRYDIEGKVVEPLKVPYRKYKASAGETEFKKLLTGRDDKKVYWSSFKITFIT